MRIGEDMIAAPRVLIINSSFKTSTTELIMTTATPKSPCMHLHPSMASVEKVQALPWLDPIRPATVVSESCKRCVHQNVVKLSSQLDQTDLMATSYMVSRVSSAPEKPQNLIFSPHIKALLPILVCTFVSIDICIAIHRIWHREVHAPTILVPAAEIFKAGSRLKPACNILHEANVHLSVFDRAQLPSICLRILRECCLQLPCSTTTLQDLLQLLSIPNLECLTTHLSTANLFHLPRICTVKCLPSTQQGI